MKKDIPVADDMTRIWQESIAVKISAVVLYAVVLVASVTAAVWLWNTDERMERELAVKADRLAYLAAVEMGGGERTAADLLAMLTTRLPDYGFSAAEVTVGRDSGRSGDTSNDPNPIVRPIPAGGGTTAVLTLYHAPLRDAVQSRRNTVFLVTGASALVFAFFLTGIILLFITRPINAIVSATRAVTAGDLSVRLDPSSRDEFGVLSHFFNRMLERIDAELTERKRAEEQLRSSHEFLRTVLDSLSDQVIIIDVNDFKIIGVNASFLAEFGLTAEKVIGRTCHEITHHRAEGCAPPADICPLLETVKTGRYAAAEHVHFDSQGKKIYVEVSSSPIYDNAGRPVQIVHVSRDITERKMAEKALRESEERFHRLSERLSRSNEELHEINEELKNFAYIVSHDLRAPLVNIKGFSEELIQGMKEIGPLFEKYLDSFDPAERKKFSEVLHKDIPEALKFIESSVSRMDTLINSILKLSRAGRRKLTPEPVSAQDLVRTIVNSLAHQIGTRSVRVNALDLPDVVADRTALEQIFGNLLDNAVKYLEPGRAGEIEVSAEQAAAEVVFYVRDNGRGIAADDIPKVFEIFKRVGKQDTPGEGMGLAYVKALVRSLGGRIWCESEPGKGSLFSFTIPHAEVKSQVGKTKG